MIFIAKRLCNNIYINKLIKLRRYCSSQQFKNVEIGKIRNLGILAHIDAGKTTTTERMLYYSGRITQMGEVHHGNTVTDYMDQERERGITIRSAAVTFNWKNHQFNLIDTPGHIDFTMEVEETLSVLDGAVVVLDGSAGVEAQTATVWRQADRYNIPRIVFVNKMDRQDADLNLCCKSIEEKLEKPTLCLQFPILENGKNCGFVDVLTMEKVISSRNEISKVPLNKGDSKLFEKANFYRSVLINKVADFNDNFANIVIGANSLNDIKTGDIQDAMKKITLEQVAVPVLCGSAYKNWGVQHLMDSAILYLPSPLEQNRHFRCFNKGLYARAFKVLHDKQRGPLVFFRIYSGSLNKGQKVYNISQKRNEHIGRLYVSYADEFHDVNSLSNGNIAVVAGLKEVIVGDLVAQSSTAAENSKKELMKLIEKEKQLTNGEEIVENIFGAGTRIPEPVFFCSIEPPSLAYQSALEQALVELQREDPSLRVTNDLETGQTILSGMGELHLDIIRDRILKEYKINAELGPLQIAYHETPISSVSSDFVNEIKVGNTKHLVSLSLSLHPTSLEDKDILKLAKTSEAASNLANLLPKHLTAIKRGVSVGISHGPKINAKVSNVQAVLHRFEVGKGTSESIISATVTQLVQKLLLESGTNVLEPIMNLEIVAPETYMSSILADLSRRRSNILNISVRGQNKVLYSETPLAELYGYSTILRTISSGTGSVVMEFLEYRLMSSLEESKAIQNVRGF